MNRRDNLHSPAIAAQLLRNQARTGALRRALGRGLAALAQWRRVNRSRRELATLDAHELRDLGLSRSQALFESGKSFLQH